MCGWRWAVCILIKIPPSSYHQAQSDNTVINMTCKKCKEGKFVTKDSVVKVFYFISVVVMATVPFFGLIPLDEFKKLLGVMGFFSYIILFFYLLIKI